MTERKIVWYRCIDMEAYLDNYSDNWRIVGEFFIEDKCEVYIGRNGDGFDQDSDPYYGSPIISLLEWDYFEPCSPPTIGEGDKPNYDTSVVPDVDYKALFAELLEVTENSDGVTGLHLNGDTATWDELENNNWLPLLKEWKESQHE